MAGVELLSIVILTLAVAFGAGLVNRKLYRQLAELVQEGPTASTVRLVPDQPHVVLYTGREGLRVLGFYKFWVRPQHTFVKMIHSTIANSRLSGSLLDNANGTFLVIHFPGKGYRSHHQVLRDALAHLETTYQTIIQEVPGIELQPASPEDIQSLTGLMGLTIEAPAPTEANEDQVAEPTFAPAPVRTILDYIPEVPADSFLHQPPEPNEEEEEPPLRPEEPPCAVTEEPPGGYERHSFDDMPILPEEEPYQVSEEPPAPTDLANTFEEAVPSENLDTERCPGRRKPRKGEHHGPTLEAFLGQEPSPEPQPPEKFVPPDQFPQKAAGVLPPPPGKSVAVVDGSNIAYLVGGEPRIGTIQRVRAALLADGYHPYIIVGSGLWRKIDDPGELKAMERREEITQAPAGINDDTIIFDAAQRHQGIVVSNDTFRDHDVPWLAGRHWGCSIVGGEVILKEMNPGRRKQLNSVDGKARVHQRRSPQAA